MSAPRDLIRRPVELQSPLPPDELLARLKAELGPPRRQILAELHPFPPNVRVTRGWVRGRHAWLANGSRVWRNSWRPTLHVRALPDGTGTLLRGRMGWSVPVTAFMALWFGFCFVGLARGEWQYAGFVAFAAALTAFGTITGRGDRRALFAWLDQVIEARPVEQRDLAGLPERR
ncbi:MAG TPA: hypothetical protein VF533_23250 [Solirubrobacteraceae bacterium]